MSLLTFSSGKPVADYKKRLSTAKRVVTSFVGRAVLAGQRNELHGIGIATAHAGQMRQKAFAEHLRDIGQDDPNDDGLPSGSSFALAIEPDADQALALEHALDGRISGKLMIVRSTEEAFTAFVDAIPDLILMSPLLAPRTEEQIVGHLRALGIDASHVQLLSIPRFNGPIPAEKKRRFGGPSQKKMPSAGSGSPAAFADEVAAYLNEAATLRQERQADEDPAGKDNPDASEVVGVEHIEQLLDRLHADSPTQAPEILIPKRDVMPMPTAHDSAREPGAARLPRFLTLDEQIPVPLRALLDEADGCLKMSFLTGAGACAVRTLDLLLSEQGIAGTDRSAQIQELAKKHPAVAESFLRVLSQVTNNPSGAWDDARVTLAIVILKAIAYEIYVLGPERKERATYVIELLERFKSAGKGGGAAA